MVSEITWLTASRPAELDEYWQQHYSEIDVASGKINVLERHGYTPMGYFVLGEECWLNHYYEPLLGQFDAFLERHGHSDEVKSLVEAELQEIAFYKKYKDYYSYGVYIAKKI